MRMSSDPIPQGPSNYWFEVQRGNWGVTNSHREINNPHSRMRFQGSPKKHTKKKQTTDTSEWTLHSLQLNTSRLFIAEHHDIYDMARSSPSCDNSEPAYYGRLANLDGLSLDFVSGWENLWGLFRVSLCNSLALLASSVPCPHPGVFVADSKTVKRGCMQLRFSET